MRTVISKVFLVAGVAIILLIAGLFLYRYLRPAPAKSPTWADAIDAAKRSIVVIKSTSSIGSGFFISPDGVIATTSSVIGGDKTVEVRLPTGTLKKAVVTMSGPAPLDIAILKIEESGNEFLAAATAEECRDGEEMRVIGAPLGVDFFIRKGTVVHCNNDRDGVKYMSTDLPFDAGSTGSPCIDKKGRVLGLYSAFRTDAFALSQVLPMSMVQGFKDGMLTSLQESLAKKEEEKAKELEQRQDLSNDSEHVYQMLKSAFESEHRSYLAYLDNLVRTHAITEEQGRSMVELKQYSPTGSGSVDDWLRQKSQQVMKGALSEDQVLQLIKQHFNH